MQIKKILILGAGRSSSVLITYLLNLSGANNWFVTVGDFSEKLAQDSIGEAQNAKAIFFDVQDQDQRELEIINTDIVISMLPPSMHILVAKDCLKFKKNLVTASYVSDEIMRLDSQAKKSGVLLLNEIGLDPGIDHMSAMKIIDDIQQQGGKLKSFKSFCGGLIHPDYDNNPWQYKFTWNPRNVVLAGQGVSQYIMNGECKSITYKRLFEETESMTVLDAGEFEGYANRDSLKYIDPYGLGDIDTIFRGTLRRKGFCKSWNMFVQLGMTDDTYIIKDASEMTCREFTNLFVPHNDKRSVEEKVCSYLNISIDSDEFNKLEWLGLFSDERYEVKNATPATILQKILENKWTLNLEDRDMVVMQHQFTYQVGDKSKKLISSLIVYGDNQRETAMAKTVGLPVAIATKLILSGDISGSGVQIPTSKGIYERVLNELSANGINFTEEIS